MITMKNLPNGINKVYYEIRRVFKWIKQKMWYRGSFYR